MSTVRSNEHAPFIEGSENGWHCVEGPPPEKVFVWDREGTYLDCQFPNPVFGHFFGGTKLLGKRVTEVLSPLAARQVIKGITRVLRQQEPSQLWIRLAGEEVCYHVCIRLIPSGQVVVGWVNDFPIPEGQDRTSRTNRIQETLSPEQKNEGLSEQERNIVQGVTAGQSNQDIADRLGIKEGTVKFHLSNIYRKLNLTSRVQLALRGAALLSSSPNQQIKKTNGHYSNNYS